jgi:hypothetical protein
MFALSSMMLFASLALVVDLGIGFIERRVVQAVADAAALAGVQVLTSNGTDSQILAVVDDYVKVRNPLRGYESGRTYTVDWLSGTTMVGRLGQVVRPGNVTGIIVTVTGNVPTVFANLWGITEVQAAASGGGGYSPLDVVLVLDKSGSMDDDSCFLKTTTSGFSLRSYAKDQCSSQMTGDGLSSDDCDNCGGRWKTSPYRCAWPDGTTMGSAVTGICGSVHTSQSACLACKGAWRTPTQPITDLRAAATTFVDLATTLAPTFPHVGLVTYSDSGSLVTQLTGNLNTVKTAISGVAAGGYTNCEDGMYRARQELTTSGRQRWNAVRVILFMSDGNANRCRTSSNCSASTAKQKAITEAQLAGTQGIIVYSIGLGADADQDMLQRMVTHDGEYLFAPTGAELDDVYRAMFQKIKRLRLVK